MMTDRARTGAPVQRLITFVALTLSAFLTFVISAHSQTVAVEGSRGENGFGWMFRQDGVCYVILPEHVPGPLPQITVTTSAPVAVGTGNVLRPFWPELDLAIAVVRGGISARCVADLSDLDQTTASRAATRIRLHRLSSSGEGEMLLLDVLERDYLTIDAEVAGERGEIYQGTSGAFAFAGEVPVGMAIESTGPSHVRLMRSEEILLNIRRFLSEQSVAFVEATTPEVRIDPGGLQLIVASVNTVPISPSLGPDNLFGEGSFVFDPLPSSDILLRVEGDESIDLSRLVIRSTPEAGYAVPRRVLISTDQGPEGTRLHPWFRGDMSPDGQFDTDQRAARSVRWIQIQVFSAWGDGPVEISSISAW